MTPAELRALADEKEQEAKNTPQRIPLADFSALMNLTDSHLEEIASGETQDDDFTQYIYEEAMMAIYGKDIFDWINKFNR